jgi:Domain of unknown function (DUF4157)
MRSIKRFICAALVLQLSLPAHSSWLSRVTGIDIDLNRGQVAIRPPDIAAIPQMLQNLPKDVGQGLLNPAAPALATAIRFSRGQALNRNPRPIPQPIKVELAKYFPGVILDKVRWTTAGGITLDGALKNWLNQEGAVTLGEVIVFSSETLTSNIELWAHELTHVLQYEQLGVETFAFQYIIGFQAMEQQATDNARRIVQSINAEKAGRQPTWAYQGQTASPNQQLNWTKVRDAAKNVIDPVQCIWINNQTNMTGNNCPTAIRVTGVVVQRFMDGARFTMPCNEQTCVFGANTSGPLLSPPGHVIVGVTSAYND